ncbi:hypothetical protein CHIBITOTORO_00610 [Serratia phage vB_SmaM-ChibiTotoro]|nr:hypothetical protein CHIBITOTORO_00610 [Serratia phage vB_SmaM-ChibiTotoro]
MLRSVRGAVGGAGTSATIQGLSSGGLAVQIQVNMAQTFVVATSTPASIDAITGGIYEFKSWCNYGSGTTRTAELWRQLPDGANELVYQAAGNTSGVSQLFEATTRIVADVNAVYWWTLNDAFGRRRETSRTEMKVSSSVTASRMTSAGGDMFPGGNNTWTSSRFTAHEVKTYPLKIITTPPLPDLGFAPGYDGGSWINDPAFNATRATIAEGATKSDALLTYPSNAVAGFGGTAFLIRGYRHLMEVSVMVPTYTNMTEIRPPATPPAGVTITVVSPTVWNISIPLSGGGKTIVPVSYPTGSDYVGGTRPDSGNTSVLSHTFPTPKSWLLTPLRAGTSTVKLQLNGYSDSPPVDLTLNVTVT